MMKAIFERSLETGQLPKDLDVEIITVELNCTNKSQKLKHQ